MKCEACEQLETGLKQGLLCCERVSMCRVTELTQCCMKPATVSHITVLSRVQMTGGLTQLRGE